MATRIIHYELRDGEERIYITDDTDAPARDFIPTSGEVISDTTFQQSLPINFPNDNEFKIVR